LEDSAKICFELNWKLSMMVANKLGTALLDYQDKLVAETFARLFYSSR